MADQTLDDTHVNWLLSSAHSYLGQNMAPQAITLLELLNALRPDNQQALRMLAYAYLLVAQHQQVLDTVATLERLNQRDEEQTAYLELLRARALWGLGKSDMSHEEYQKYIQVISNLESKHPE